MPIYEYRCPNGHVFELFQKMSDPPPEVCEVCGEGPLEKLLFPVAVHFKGSGFYSTDYGRGGRKPTGRRHAVERDGDVDDKGEQEATRQRQEAGADEPAAAVGSDDAAGAVRSTPAAAAAAPTGRGTPAIVRRASSSSWMNDSPPKVCGVAAQPAAQLRGSCASEPAASCSELTRREVGRERAS